VVTDTGPGIPKDELGTVFEAFAQSRTGRKRPEGTGLGLAISDHYVKLMRGALRLESELGRGTTAGFTIPMRIAAGARIPEASRGVAAVAPGQPVYRILVADDGQAMRHLIRRLLEPLGFEVREAHDGSEAATVWQEWRPHLILMDLRMPVVDGWEATRSIKAELDGDATVIVAVTASSFEDQRAEAIAAGCDDYLRKPFGEGDLFDLLQKHLRVRFLFRAPEPPATSPPLVETTADSLASLDHTLRTKLKSALISLDQEGVRRALEEIDAQDSVLARALRPLADKFQYASILRLLEDGHGGGEWGQ
jgi:CheY-like chemotaxis protein